LLVNTHNADTKDEFYEEWCVSSTFANEPLASEKMPEMSRLAEEPLAVYRFLYFVELYVNVRPGAH
jgi:hypothetical protein